jgi:hypothetical protein
MPAVRQISICLKAGLASEAAYTALIKLSAMEAGMGDLDEKIVAGEPLMQQALQALRLYNEAQGVKPAEEVERLRLEAETLMTAVSAYQLRALGSPARILH